MHFLKKIHLIILFLVFACPVMLYSQAKNDSIKTYGDIIGTKQDTAWNNLYTVWHSNFFYDCLSNNNLRISCAHYCDAVYMDIDFKIDDKGFVTEHRIINQSMCGDNFTEKLKNCFLTYFLSVTFPVELRNIVLEVRLGSVLKC